jgi:hypothetical protein
MLAEKLARESDGAKTIQENPACNEIDKARRT